MRVKSVPARDHRLARLRLGRVDEGQDLPQTISARKTAKETARSRLRASAVTPRSSLCAGRPAARRSRPRCAKQLVLDRDHVGQQQAVGVARARRADRDVVDDGAAAHRDDPVGERQRLVHVMGDEDDGRDGPARLFPQVEQHVLQLVSRHIVQRAERLVEQQHAAAIGEDGGDGDALQHAA